jgi:adenine-specific DNA-methyltransferase
MVKTNNINIENRRYIGNKTKLTNWIMDVISHDTKNVHSFCDIFAGTGAISDRALKMYDRVIINDFLYSNNVIYKAFFGKGAWNKKKLLLFVKKYNQLNPCLIPNNYFSQNYGGKYFEYSIAKIIGYIREDLELRKEDFTEKEFDILLTSLIYSIDKLANTLGHFEAYIKKPIIHRDFIMSLINARSYENVEIYREDANVLARKIQCDVVYLDPPYNSRQYSRFYHVYENLIKWDKPKLYGIAMKPQKENMSVYCQSKALYAFKDLVNNLNTKYIVVSYNNTYHSKSSSSKNKISLEDLKNTLEKRGETRVYTHKYNAFQAGKTRLYNHKEYLFVTKIR